MKVGCLTLALFAVLTPAASAYGTRHPRYMRRHLRFHNGTAGIIVSPDEDLAISDSASASVPLSTGVSSGAAGIITAAPFPTNGTGSGTTTLTVSTTSVHTVTSCLPEVVNCPTKTEDLANLPTESLTTAIVTDTIVLTTTVCPVTAVPSITSSVLSEHSKGIITGSTLSPSETSAAAPVPTTTGVSSDAASLVTSAAPSLTTTPTGAGTGITTVTVSTTSVHTSS
ncbi:hypothetical protein VTH06DRAFT_1560, partial [Thermothelomyces fergusii]